MNQGDIPHVEVRSRAALRAWLEANHATSSAAWAILYKKHHPDYVSWDHLVEELLCFGWIDSVRRTIDEDRLQQYIAPRKRGGNWSAVNKARVERLEAVGLMTEAGRRRIREAQEDGSWSASDEVEQLLIPPDLAALLDADPVARGHFEAYSPSTKKLFLTWIASAKTAPTRQRRLDGTLAAARENVRTPGYVNPPGDTTANKG